MNGWKKYILILSLLMIPILGFSAEVKVTGLPEDTSPTYDDLLLVTDAPAGTPASRKVQISNFTKSLGWYDVRSYASINAAITAIGATQTTLAIPNAQTLTGNLTIPSTLKLIILKGGSIIKASTYTLAINGPFEAGLYQVFSGFSSGDVTFGSGYVNEIYPEWWGIDGNDDEASIKCALSSILGRGEGTIKLSAREYVWENDIGTETGSFDLTGTTGIKIKGEGYGTLISASGTITGYSQRVLAFQDGQIEISDLRLVTSQAADLYNAISLERCSKSKVHDIYLFNNNPTINSYDRFGIVITDSNDIEVYGNYLENFQIEISHKIKNAKIHHNTSITPLHLGICCIVSDTSGDYLRDIHIYENYIYQPVSHAIAVVTDTSGNGSDQVIERIKILGNTIICSAFTNTAILLTNATNAASYSDIIGNTIYKGKPFGVYYMSGTGWQTSITDVKISENIVIDVAGDIYIGLYDQPITRFVITNNIITSSTMQTGYAGLKPDKPSYCLIKNNQVYNYQYGLQLSQNSQGYNIIEGNDFSGCTTQANTSQFNSTDIIHHNSFKTENSGLSSAIATGGTIAHGLITTPAFVSVTAAEAGPTDITVSADATNITVNFGGGGSKTFYWRTSIAQSK